MGMDMTSMNSQQEKNSIVAITNDNTSSGGSVCAHPPEVYFRAQILMKLYFWGAQNLMKLNFFVL